MIGQSLNSSPDVVAHNANVALARHLLSPQVFRPLGVVFLSGHGRSPKRFLKSLQKRRSLIAEGIGLILTDVMYVVKRFVVCGYRFEAVATTVDCVVCGPEGTPYYGGLFHFRVEHPHSYPVENPTCTNLTTGQKAAPVSAAPWGSAHRE